MTSRQRATAFAPASTANLAVGFDILGHSLSRFGDRVTAVRAGHKSVRVVTSGGPSIPFDPATNTAAAGVLAMVEDLQPGCGFDLEVEKGIPLGSGIGGSAASAVAGVVAVNALLGRPLADVELLRYALIGEAVASGSVHCDNVAPALLGGLVLVRSVDPIDVVQLLAPRALRCVSVLPQARLDTRVARAALPNSFPLPLVVQQSANLAGVVSGLCTGDLALIARSMRDVLVEPYRAPLVSGFSAVQQAALSRGALACSLSGAGPALFAWCEDELVAAAVQTAMIEAFSLLDMPSTGWISTLDEPGAKVEHVS